MSVFDGEFTRNVQRGGWVRFPKAWLAQLEADREVFIMPDPTVARSLLIVSAEEFNKKLKRLSTMKVSTDVLNVIGDNVEQVKIAADGRMRIPARMLAHAGIRGSVCFVGQWFATHWRIAASSGRAV